MNENAQDINQNFNIIKDRLEEKGIVATPHQTYRGPGIAEIFGTDESTIQLRLGRKHSEGHEDFKFGDSNSIMEMLTNNTYAVFVPLTAKNIKAIKEGRPLQYSVAKDIQEDKEGFITSLDPRNIQEYTGNISNLIFLMPKKRIPKVSATEVRIGNSVVNGVKSSNPDDNGDVEIYSKSGMSSVLYNPTQKEAPRPCFHWGSNGWKKPLEVMVKGDQLFFDERKKPEGKLWLLSFQTEGYDPISL